MADTEYEHPTPGRPASPGSVPEKRNGATLICAVDPQGFIVTLDVHRWEDHIAKRHPEMSKHLERIKRTIEDPQLIQAAEGSTTAYYYRLTGMAEKKASDLYILVVVDRNEKMKTGVVKTAHLLKTIKPNESRIVWLKQS
jgi:hypothetical protein